MKKRLLSAALALAMVLTLLPVSAFAAGETVGETVRYFAAEVTTGEDYVKHGIGWYRGSGTAASPYVAVTDGVALGSSAGSGAWYPSVSGALAASGSVISVIGNTTDADPVWIGRNVTIDLYGKDFSHNIKIPGRVESPTGSGNYVANGMTSLTIQDSLTTGAKKTGGANITIGQNQADWGLRSFTLKLNNVKLGGQVDFFSMGSSSITVDNAEVTSFLKIFGVGSGTSTTSTGNKITVTGSGASVGGVIEVNQTSGDGVVSVTNGAKVDGLITVSQPNGSGNNVVSVSGGGKANGGITVNQDSGSNTVTVTGSGSRSGHVAVTQETGGSVTASNSAAVGRITLNSTKGSTATAPSVTVTSSATAFEIVALGDSMQVSVTDDGRVKKDSGGAGGNVKVFGRYSSDLTGNESTTLAAPTVTVQGGIVEGNIGTARNSGAGDGLAADYTVKVSGGGTVSGTINLWKALITVTGGTVTGTTTLNSGVLTAGPNANMGNVVLGANVANADKNAYGLEAVMNVTGMGNTIGAINEARTNNRKLVLTIPGITDPTKQNPRDNDTNKIVGVWLGNVNDPASLVDKARSYIAGGHYKNTLWGTIPLLTDNITYVVQETNNANGFGDYVYSYWGNSVNQINVLAGMTNKLEGIDPDGGTDKVPTIWTKDAPLKADDGTLNTTSARTVSLYSYVPRTQPTGDPATSVGTEDGSVESVLNIMFKKPANGSISTFILPSVLGTNKSVNWSQCTVTNDKATVTPNTTKVTGGASIAPTDDVAYVSNGLSYQVTKVLDVQTAANNQYNATVKAKLEGSTIVLSGLAKVYGTGNSAVIPLVLETDAKEEVFVDAVWNPADKTLFFTDPGKVAAGNQIPTLSIQTGGGLIIANDNNSQLLLVSNNTKIGLKAGSLTEDTLKNVTFQGNTAASKGGMVTTTSRLSDTQAYGSNFKKALAEAMTKPAGVGSTQGVVDFSLSPTVQQEFGSYIAKLNQSTLDGYLKKVQQDKYMEKHPKADRNKLTASQLAETGYNTIAVVLYMNVDVTAFGNNIPYTMTATMTPYARVEIQHNDNAGEPDNWTKYPPVVVVNGTSLGTLDSGNVGQVEVTIPSITSVFPGQTAAAGYVHQNSTYVAAVTNQEFTLTHTAANGAGFGTIVLNNVEPLAEIKKNATGVNYTPAKLYDTVQAAVDEAKNGETINVNGAIGSTVEYPISVTGRARTIYIDVTGNRKITKANNASDVIITQPTGNSTMYTVQLTKDNAVVKPTEKPIPISVTSATGGAASVSASRADEGDTITVTLTPATNYRVGGVTVTAAVKNSSTGVTTNTTVATTAASANSWRFVVPTGATSVTVTPSFVATSTGATVTVSSATGGTATTSAGTNRVAPGSTVSVTTVPSSGYRTMGLVVTSNTGSATATRTGVNSYVFTVPAGSTNVVVTPRFDVNNGTVFEDVWSTEYFSSAVAWAVGRGVTNGTDTYHFSPYNNCTRADMVTFLYRAAGSPAVGNVANPFWDVQPGSYYYNAVLWAVSKGITNGVSANQFGVNQIVTRAQAVTFLHRYNGSPAPASGNRFYDVPAREYYANAVAWATGKGVTNGTSTTLFSPNQAVTRAQAVAFLYRDFNNVRA